MFNLTGNHILRDAGLGPYQWEANGPTLTHMSILSSTGFENVEDIVDEMTFAERRICVEYLLASGKLPMGTLAVVLQETLGPEDRKFLCDQLDTFTTK